jgi:predicted O-methyltransferase YrrM
MAAWVYEVAHPKAPWLTSEAIGLLCNLLRPIDHGLEYGSGRSTAWLAQRTKHLLSVETSAVWHARVSQEVRRLGLEQRVDLRLVPASEGLRDEQRDAYIGVVRNLPADSLDYVLVDAIYRGECAMGAVDALRLGGVLILDNAERYLPHATRSPERLMSVATDDWLAFERRVEHWRCLWTSNGVSDTAIWIKTD